MAGLFLSRVGSSWLRGSFLTPTPSFPSSSVARAWAWRGLALERHRAADFLRPGLRVTGCARTQPRPHGPSLGSYPQSRTPAHAPSPPLFLRCRDGRFLAPGGRWPRPSPRTGHRSAPLRKWSPSWRRGRRASQRVWGRGAARPGPGGSSNSGPWGSQAALLWR